MALVTLTQAKTHLNVPTATTTYDDEITYFISVASDLVEGYADRKFALNTSSQLFDGGVALYILNVSPVTAVTGVTVDGTALASTAYDTDIQHGIVRLDSAAAEGTANVTISYMAGLASVPNLVQHATLETVRHLWQTQRGSMGARNPLNGDDYTAGMSFSLPRRVMELLDPLRNVG